MTWSLANFLFWLCLAVIIWRGPTWLDAWRVRRQFNARRGERRSEVAKGYARLRVASVTDLRTGRRYVQPGQPVAGDKLTRDEIAALLEAPSYEERRP